MTLRRTAGRGRLAAPEAGAEKNGGTRVEHLNFDLVAPRLALAGALRKPRRVALVHYWIVSMRGGERVLEQLVHLYPEAEIFTHLAVRSNISDVLLSRPIHETFISRLPGARRHYQKYVGLMPRALEELDLGEFDLVISSEAGPAKGVIARADATHVCYCHSPMRYIWDQYPQYRASLKGPARMYFAHIAHKLRQWDVASAARVDSFVANSRFVAGRVARAYNRSASVVHPPVDLAAFRWGPAGGRGKYYLFVSELVRYKRADLVIEAFRHIDRPLKIVGGGEEFARLAADLPANVELLGRLPLDELVQLYQGARALVFPAQEDFGIVPLEAMACGTPVLAYESGGACETVVDGVTGLFFPEQSVEAIKGAVAAFEQQEARFDASRIAAYAATFSEERFRLELASEIEEARRCRIDCRPPAVGRA
jgi:glycosyltransferase involved in cell wall biosynthesis